VLVGIVGVAAVTGWVLMSGDVSAIASEVGASLSFGLQADADEGDPLVDVFVPLRVSSEPGGARVIIARGDGGEKALAVRAVDPTTGRVQDLGIQLPADVATGTAAVGARWDEPRGRLIVVARPASGRVVSAGGAADSLDFWLVQFKAATQAVSGGSH
jgi:hypothetical protein